MKDILSFNVPTNDFTLTKMIDFYFTCRESKQTIYLYQDKKTCKIERLAEFITYILLSQDERLLLIIEGQKAKTTMKKLIHQLYAKNSSRNSLCNNVKKD